MIFGNQELYLEISQGNTSLQVGNYREALKHYSKAIELDPKNAELWNLKGVSTFRIAHRNHIKSKYKEAIKCYNKAIDLDKNYAEPWSNKGVLYREMGNHKKAIKCFTNSINLDPDDCIGWTNLGMEHYKTGRLESALTSLNRALSINSNKGIAWRYKGKVLRDLGKYEESLKCFEKSIISDPETEAIPIAEKAITLKKLKRYQEAIECCKELKNIGQDFAADNLMGEIYLEMGNYENALKSLKNNVLNDDGFPMLYGEFLELNITEEDILNNFGMVYEKLNKFEEAIKYFKKSLDVNPDQPNIKENLEQLELEKEELKDCECPVCGAQVDNDASFCPECNAEFEEDAYSCPDCGNIISKNAEYCSYCGSIFEEVKTDEQLDLSEDNNQFVKGAILDKLQELKEMEEKELITEEEFNRKKKDILDDF